MDPHRFASRLSSVLALLSGLGCRVDADDDTDTDPGLDSDDAALLASCAIPTTWTPDTDERQGLRRPQDCIVVPADVACPDVTTPLPWTTPGGTPGNSCATSRTLCISEFLGREPDLVDTATWDSDVPDSAGFDRCCYRYVGPQPDYVCGRPHRVDGAIVVAPTVAAPGWSAALPVAVPADPADRAAAAARWLADALTEHASIAAFARLQLDLLAHGAPADLVAATAAAMQDEVRHAAEAFAVASALAGRTLAPGPLPIEASPTPSLVELAVATARDGGVGEALAAATAAARLSVTTDPHTRAVLARVVEDEARHAELAWRVVAWAIEVGGDAVRDAVDAELARLRDDEATSPIERHVPALGLCGGEALAVARQAVWRDVLSA